MILGDIRLKRTFLDMLYPSPKEDMNPRSLSHLRLVLRSKDRCVLFATFPKSGLNWAGDVLTYCIVKHFLGRYDLTYLKNPTLKQSEKKPFNLFTSADSRSRNKPMVREMIPGLDIDYCFHTHGYWKESPLWGLDKARTVIITRHIPTTFYSYYMSRADRYSSMEELIDQEKLIARVTRFYNTWGQFCETHGNHKIFTFESFRKQPEAVFPELVSYVFNVKVDKALISEAIDYYSFEKVKKREFDFCEDESKHFHQKGALDYTGEIPEHLLARIYRRLGSDLRYKFGYEYPGA